MSEPGDLPGLAELVRPMAARISSSAGNAVQQDELERLLNEFANAVRERSATANGAATKRFTELFSASPIGIALADTDGIIVEVNPALGRILDCGQESLQGQPIPKLAATETYSTKLAIGLDDLPSVGMVRYSEPLLIGRMEREPLWARTTLAALSGDREDSLYPILMIEDVNDIHLLQETLRHQTVHDSLTGLPNDAYFANKLDAMLASGIDDQIALVYLDIDGFKVINDGLGAGVADRVLREVASKLASVFTSYDAFVARLSGDGFAVLLHGNLVATDVIALVERALDELAEPVYVGDWGVGISASVGIVVRGVTEGPRTELLRAAEIALHRAKAAGKAQWMLFDPELDERDRGRYLLGAAIAGGLETGQFYLRYQPSVRLTSQATIDSVHVNLHWDHPDLGDVNSQEFYPLAETTGMAIQLGRYAISQVIETVQQWRRLFAENTPAIEVNLPKRIACDPDLVRLIKTGLDRNDVPAHSLILRTQSDSLIDPQGEVFDSLTVLAELGAQLALTVTGTADLDLANACDLPIQHAVLTGHIVDISNGDGPAQRRLAQVINQAHECGFVVTAEGVDSAEQLERLREHGVTAARGPSIAESLTRDDIDDLIRQRMP